MTDLTSSLLLLDGAGAVEKLGLSRLTGEAPALPRVPQATSALDLAVIIPTLNERGNVSPLLDLLTKALAGYRWEAVFVDDGSRDGTPAQIAVEAAKRGNVRMLRRFGRRGLSSAVVEGMLATTAPVVAVIDADLQHDESILPQLYRAVANDGADVAVGTRYTEGGSVEGWNKTRARISAFATGLSNKVMRLPVSDPMSGFFVIRQSLLVDVVPKLSTVGFKILLDIILSGPKDIKVAEVPYKFRTRVSGESKLDMSVAIDYGLLLIEKMSRGWINPRLVMFMAVGGLGLIANLILLKLFMSLNGGWFKQAQAFAVVATIACNYVVNNLFTYRDRRLKGRAFWRGLASFYLVCGWGAVANIWFSDLAFASNPNWWMAGIAGAVVAALWNYTASSIFTWKKS